MRVRLNHILPVMLLFTASCEQADPSGNGQSALSNVAPTLAPDTLKAEARDKAVNAFYEKHGWTAIWSPQAEQALTTALQNRAVHGLDRIQFIPDISKSSPAAREVALTGAALHFADALAHGASDPVKIHSIYTLPRPKRDISAGLISAAQAGNIDAWLASLSPDTAEYRLLSDTYLQQRKASDAPKDKTIATGDVLEPGDKDPRVPQVVAALVENRYLARPLPNATPPAQDAEGALYGPIIVRAVKAFQDDFGIRPDGIIGKDTLAILNVQPIDRARSIAVAMERLRWLSRTPPTTRIDVNIAAAEMRYIRDGKLMDQRNVVVGQPDRETPQIESAMFRLVANPTWTVPKSIQTTEMAGKGAAYFRRNNMDWKDGWIVQKSGPRNALGLVKFDMQNDLAIYLHDTPAKTLFDKNQRQLSHGCVRVSDAIGFAQMVAEHQGIAAQWTKARKTGEQTFVPLPQKLPVRLLYRTVYVGDGNQVMYRTDPYGWNVAVAEALGFTKDPRKQFRSKMRDIGP